MSDDFRAIEGQTLEDEIHKTTDPPDEYGRPDPCVVIEEVAGISWAWHTKNVDADLQFEGDSVKIKQ